MSEVYFPSKFLGRNFVSGFSNIVTMPSPPPLVSVAASDQHSHYLGHLHQQHLPDVCVPVTIGITQASNLSHEQLNGLGLRPTTGCQQAMVISPASSPTRMDSYNIPVLSGTSMQDVEALTTKQLANNQFMS